MNKNLTQVQWLVFWLAVWLPLALMAADVAPPAAAVATAAVATAVPPSLPLQDSPSTEPEFETLRDAESIDNRSITALAQDARGLIWIGTQTKSSWQVMAAASLSLRPATAMCCKPCAMTRWLRAASRSIA